MSAMGRADDQEAAFAAVSSVLKVAISPREMRNVHLSYQGEKITLEYKGHKGFITRKDAKDWGTSLGAIVKAVSRHQYKQQGHGYRPKDPHDWVSGDKKESLHDEQLRMMGITPSLTEQVVMAEAKSHKTKRDLRSKVGMIPKGTKVNLEFQQRNGDEWVLISGPGESSLVKMTAPGGQNIRPPVAVRVRARNLHSAVTGALKPPGQKSLEKQTLGGIARTVTGATIEPDGYGPDGAPSWPLAMGVM